MNIAVADLDARENTPSVTILVTVNRRSSSNTLFLLQFPSTGRRLSKPRCVYWTGLELPGT